MTGLLLNIGKVTLGVLGAIYIHELSHWLPAKIYRTNPSMIFEWKILPHRVDFDFEKLNDYQLRVVSIGPTCSTLGLWLISLYFNITSPLNLPLVMAGFSMLLLLSPADWMGMFRPSKFRSHFRDRTDKPHTDTLRALLGLDAN